MQLAKAASVVMKLKLCASSLYSGVQGMQALYFYDYKIKVGGQGALAKALPSHPQAPLLCLYCQISGI